MAFIGWNGSTGLWGVASNWLGGLVPTVADSVDIASGNVTNNSSVSVVDIYLYSSATLTTSADMTIGTQIRIGHFGPGTARLSITGGTTSTALIEVGLFNAGILTVSGGGNVTATSAINVGNGAIVGSVIVGGATAAAAGTINGNITFGNAASSLLFRTTDSTAYGGNISGAGTVTIDSAGQTTTFIGDNSSHSGALTISAGTLQIGNGGGAGTLGTGAIVNNGQLAFSFAASALTIRDIANVISGSGSVQFSGFVDAFLLANNSYTGSTSLLNDAFVYVGNGGTTGSLGQGDVTIGVGCRIYLNRSGDAFTVANNIGGSGNVVVQGTATAIFTGTNSYGGTVIFPGATLQIGDGGTAGTLGTGAVTNDGVLAFSFGKVVVTTRTIGNEISGSGSVQFTGSIDAYLTANNSYAGTTSISGNAFVFVGNGGNSGSLGAGDVTIGSVSALYFNRSGDAFTVANNILGGTGDVYVVGTATAIFTGANSYRYTLVHPGATLQIGNGGTTGTLGTDIVFNSGTLVFEHSNGQYVHANVISGTGNLVVSGTINAFEILTGNNTYSGTTTVESGVLAIGAGGASGTLGTGNVILLNNGYIDFNRSDTQLISNNISGAGTVRAFGEHTVILTGDNSYGTTFISSVSTLQIGNGGTTGTLGAGAVTNDGVLAFSFGNAVVTVRTIGNEISGSGSVQYTGTVDAYQTANNSYAGTTSISGNAFVFVGQGGTTGSLGQGDVTIGVGSRLYLNRSGASFTVANNISGSGDVYVQGTATAIFTGANSYGATTINAGSTLQIGNGGTAGTLGTGAVTNDGVLSFNRSNDIEVANAISGTGLLAQNGSGTLRLTGNNTFTGDTNVNAGTLALAGAGSISGAALIALNGATSRFDISEVGGPSASVRNLDSVAGAQTILGGKTLNVTHANGDAGAGAFAGSAGTDAVVFNVASTNFTLAGANGATFTDWTDGIDTITINGNAGANTLTGDEVHATRISGDAGSDTLIGGSGEDVLNGGSGADQLYGGAGGDFYSVDTQADIVFEAVDSGIDGVSSSVSFYLYDNIEVLSLAGGAIFGVGNALNNEILGNELENLLLGGDGGDFLSGGGARDALFGEGGDDQMLGSDGVDYIVAGAGNDVLEGGDDPDEMYGEADNDFLDGGDSFHTDIMVGGQGNDTIDGNSGLGDYDLMYGNQGDDTFYVDTPADLVFEQVGEGNADRVFADIVGAGYYLYDNIETLILEGNTPFGVGNALDNTLVGNAIGNYLLGGEGNDILNGMAGNDVLFGEGGADTFVFQAGTGGDVIGDFAAGVDKINLTGIFATFAEAQANFIQNGNVGAINLGNGDFVVLQNATMSQLTATDFIFG